MHGVTRRLLPVFIRPDGEPSQVVGGIIQSRNS